LLFLSIQRKITLITTIFYDYSLVVSELEGGAGGEFVPGSGEETGEFCTEEFCN